MMNRNADIDSGSYIGLFVDGREDMKYGSVAVELERFIPVYKGDFGPTFGDESFPITVDWGVEGWGLYATYQTPGRYFVKWRAGVARIRYELEVQLPDGSAQTLTDLDLTSTSSVSFGMDISESNRSGPWVMRPGERGSRWAYRDTAVSWGRSEGAGWW